MDDRADFTSYMVARWPALVRSLVLLGGARHEAEDVAQEGMARCHLSWDRVRRADDVDVHVYRTVLECWARSRKRVRTDEAAAETQPEVHLVAEEALQADRVALREALERALERLEPELREVLVLRFVAGLTQVQVADVLGLPLAEVHSRQTAALGRIDVGALREETQ